MGLIGTMLTPIAAQSDLMLMSPVQFVRDPTRWILCFGRHGATVGAAPAQGYVQACQKVNKEALEGCDLSGWQMAIIGAEPLRASALELFMDVFGPYGVRGEAFCPAYGLAEATLAATGVPVDEEPGVLPDGWTPDLPSGGDDATIRVRHGSLHPHQVVGSGRPLDGVELSIRDLAGDSVPDGTLGEIWVGGTSLADGYEPPEPESWPAGWFRTGDVGCIVQHQLFVFGRVSDSFRVGGTIVLAEHAELHIKELVPDARALVVVPSRQDGVGVTVLAESDRSWTSQTADDLRRSIADTFNGIETDLIILKRGAIPRTTSGKPRRQESWRRYVAAG